MHSEHAISRGGALLQSCHWNEARKARGASSLRRPNTIANGSTCSCLLLGCPALSHSMDDIIEVAETDQGTTDQNGAVMTADVPFDAPSQPHVDAVAASVHTIPPAASQLANAGALEIEEVSRHTIGSTLAIFPTTGSTVIHLPAIGSTTAIVSTGFSPRLRPEHGTTLKPLLAPNHRAEASWPQRAERGERERGFLSRRPLILGERDEPPLPRRSPPPTS